MTLRATYRLQFHRDFTFRDARDIVPYLAMLGVSHLYASPILTAQPGSRHGYDGIDPTEISAELGGEAEFRALAERLHQESMGIILDIVPNHMAVGPGNLYWRDVLEKGRASVFAGMFDIDWDPPDPALRDKVLLPVLGEGLDEALAQGRIALHHEALHGTTVLRYGEQVFPIRREDRGGAASIDLVALIGRQHYVLAPWREAGARINWRRFFDIGELAALRAEDDAVFERTHGTVLRLFAQGLIDGLRIDHVDGLADPAGYLLRLRGHLEALAPKRPAHRPRRPWIFVEKILGAGEALPPGWRVDGTTGYEVMNLISGLQHDPEGEGRLTQLWEELSGRPGDFAAEECEARQEIVQDSFAAALVATAQSFAALAPGASTAALAAALVALLRHMRVYRVYAACGANPHLAAAGVAAAAELTGNARDALAAILRAVQGPSGGQESGAAADAVRRFNHLAAPVAAKAVEDTAFYRYGRLLSRNDVGFSPAQFAVTVAEFHAANTRRQQGFPHSLLAGSTHDHKRGEDARARLAVLSEIPGLWDAEVHRWFAHNASLRPADVAPAAEYQLYQTLVGAWPADAQDGVDLEAFRLRILAWREKSLREAKQETSWAAPNAAVEEAHAAFVTAILRPAHGFLAALDDFVERIAPAGAVNGLAGCVLRTTLPGTPDIYQGAEFWDFSLVDPDNRRPVDFPQRRRALALRRSPVERLPEWRNGRVKQAVLAQLLSLRTRLPDLFARGSYEPLDTGTPAVVAFLRRWKDERLLVAVPRLCAAGTMELRMPLPPVTPASFLPADLQGVWEDGLDPGRARIHLTRDSGLFTTFPALVLLGSGGAAVRPGSR